MVTLNKIYTRTGDDGTTALADGSRRVKYDLRIESYGAVDEANAAIGLARLHTKGTTLDDILARLQNDLFDLGADLATPNTEEDKNSSFQPLRILPEQVTRVEQEIDLLNADLTPLTSFVLPGGEPAAAFLHLARTIIRRAERNLIRLSDERDADKINEVTKRYINRASDLLFVAGRVANNNGSADVLWQPGATRGA